MSKKRKLSKSLYNETYKNKDKGGTSRQGIIDWKKCARDKDLKFLILREGTNKVNIIPFEIKSKLHPMVKAGKMEIGDLDFMLDIWIHRYMGPSGADVLCPKKNYGKSCPACEKSSEYYSEGKKDEAKKMKATRRTFMNIQPIIRGEAEEMKIWEVSHFLFMKELIEEAHECKEGKDIVPFADIEDGYIVKFRMTMEPFGDNERPDFKSFDFLDRQEELDEKCINQAISFDEGLILLSYEEIERIMYGQDEKDEEDDKEDTSKKKDENEDEKPDREKKDDNDKDGDKSKKEKVSNKNECPHGHKWGSADEHKDCKKCGIWDDCIDTK